MLLLIGVVGGRLFWIHIKGILADEQLVNKDIGRECYTPFEHSCGNK
ncbi:MAG TPA: hypothetical protein PKA77_17190 [Chitinophagaceae bacterium]|jgi:hypothetical protein|nr:hypothetical protein [Chitinophagaceae bacterium]HMU60094.1 hypothetical protein [Chitinophagaceae bacterium]